MVTVSEEAGQEVGKRADPGTEVSRRKEAVMESRGDLGFSKMELSADPERRPCSGEW